MSEVAKIMGPFEKQLKPNAAKFPYALSWKWRILRLGQTRSIIVSIRISRGSEAAPLSFQINNSAMSL
jgi:hypothetical protein